MIDKITLYREVLELEPGSRVFFPLAKLLAEKEPAESINILKKGLSRHPDHIEARIFLIELLSANDGDADLDNELEIVSSILRNYPSFWKIWGAHLAQNSDLQDAALAINFFGAGLSGHPITWTDVIAQGLNALLVEAGDETTPLLPSSSDYASSDILSSSTSSSLPPSFDGSNSPASLVEEAVPHFDQTLLDATVGADALDITDASDGLDAPEAVGENIEAAEEGIEIVEEGAKAAEEADKAVEAPEALEFAGEVAKIAGVAGVAEVGGATDGMDETVVEADADEEEGEEQFSLRTRTMADLLAEQGDYAGAIDIYNEILSVASESERSALEQRLQDLEELRRQSAVPGTPKKEAAADADGDGGKLVSLLESLAARFENRAR